MAGCFSGMLSPQSTSLPYPAQSLHLELDRNVPTFLVVVYRYLFIDPREGFQATAWKSSNPKGVNGG